jgi:hypothetical protein
MCFFPGAKKISMKKITTTIICLLSVVCLYAQSGFSTNLLFVAKLVGDEVVPPVTTTAIGEASFYLNSSHDSLCVNLSVRGLSGAITGVTINEGHIGGNGTMVVDLTQFIAGNKLSAIITSPALNNLFIATLMNGDFYVQITTAANPNGELRGQIEVESDWPYKASLDGSQEIVPVTTNGTGMVTFDLSRSMRSLHIRGAFENLSNTITGVVLEKVQNGNPPVVVYDLSSTLTGNIIDTEIDPDTFAIDITHGYIYLNIYTATNPTGEIRGQLIKQKTFSFDARINGNQVVPPMPTTAIGTGLISFNSTLDTLWYDFMFSGLSSPVSSVDLYSGAPGAAGTLAATLSSNPPGNRIQGSISASALPAGFFNECLMGTTYVNVSTTTNTTGEIRGQLLRFAREGFTFTIDASQETPPTSSSAVGTGIASIDRDADNLHFRMIVGGLTGPVVNAHFHNGAIGQPGLVIFDLTPYFTLTGTDDGAFNYWMKTAGFDSTKVYLFLNDQVYVNIHTSQYPNGEVRGQVLHNGTCSNIQIGVNEINLVVGEYSVYPNPFANEQLNVSFTGYENSNGNLVLRDLSGRIVSTKSVDINRGLNTYQIAGDVQSGIYMLEIQIGAERQLISKVVKM